MLDIEQNRRTRKYSSSEMIAVGDRHMQSIGARLLNDGGRIQIRMALSGKLDSHFTALWHEGHIKFWSIPTPKKLLLEVTFSEISFQRVGRIPVFAKSMIAVARRPQNT